VLTFGVSYRPIKPLLIAFDAQFTGWSTYKSLDINFAGDGLSAFDQHITKDYKDAWAFRLGAQYGVTKRFDVRAGFIVDLTPVNDNYYNPETPGMTKLEPSVGLSFRPIPSLSIDLSMLYVAGLGANNVTAPYTDMLAAQYPALQLPTTKQFDADYRLHAFVPSFGISYSF
jgi:long-chain fatty acid transport protein